MEDNKTLAYIKDVLENMPNDWLKLTTHRLDIYTEKLAKTQFLEQFEVLFENNDSTPSALGELPTAYDYIRLGHPLSCVLEWTIAQINKVKAANVISFSSSTTPVLAVLRKNLLEKKNTRILYTSELPEFFDVELLRNVYGYTFDLEKIEKGTVLPDFEGSTIFITENDNVFRFELNPQVDFFVNFNPMGSVILVNNQEHENYIPEIQHVRRRETIAMTPKNCLIALKQFIGQPDSNSTNGNRVVHKAQVLDSIAKITGIQTKALVASSGLSMQYAIVMGLIHHAKENHQGKDIKIVIPPNCYGGTNDQARRVAACIDNVEVMDLPVDSGHDMAQSVDVILDKIADEDAVPYIIAEIPTNPRVEVPNLSKLEQALGKERLTANGTKATPPVFILDQTFCPNTSFLREEDILSTIQTIAYVSGSKFPSGGKCTAGYCVVNDKANIFMEKVGLHLAICDNEATDQQYEILASQMPSMIQRINDAYKNTREFVTFIQKNLPDAKINFVSEELAAQGFTPSVFSLDLPTKGSTEEEREAYKRRMNLELIDMMIHQIPDESKYCVSYGQLKGCYWTIPATSTQGTTKEGDKDYIARVACAPDMDLEKHKKVFSEFVEKINNES